MGRIYWELMGKDEWWLMLDDVADGFMDPLGYVKKTRGVIPYAAKIEGVRGQRFFEYLTDAKRYVESYYNLNITKKRKSSKSKWVRLV